MKITRNILTIVFLSYCLFSFGKSNKRYKNIIVRDTTNFEQIEELIKNKLKLEFNKYNIATNYTKKITSNINFKKEVWKIIQSNKTLILNISYKKKDAFINENYFIKENVLIYSKKTKDYDNYDFQDKCEYYHINEDVIITEMAIQTCIQYNKNECDSILILEDFNKRKDELKYLMKENE